ncbi:MAG: SH3 domain-containing protein [Magnetospiraceae bacterium]
MVNFSQLDRRRRRRFLHLFGAALILPGSAIAADRRGSGLPMPRFVSLRAAEVNMRTGPGVRYPVAWVYRRSGLPVEVIAEFDTWRKVRDWQGSQGWIHQSMLSGRRTFIAVGGPHLLHREADEQAPPVAQIEDGVVGKILSYSAAALWCRVETQGYRGWIPRTAVWGVYPTEDID